MRPQGIPAYAPRKEAASSLLGPSDPGPVEIVRPDGSSGFLFVCEHAGRAIPVALGDLGIAATEMDRHMAYDIGGEGLSRTIATLLDAPLVLQRYSRLVVDCNRPFEAPDCIPEISDGTTIPANRSVSQLDRIRRFGAIHRPFHDCIAQQLDLREHGRRPTILVAMHSFTPRYAGKDRLWQVGVCANRDQAFARKFLEVFTHARPGIIAALNEPYPVDDLSDYTIPVHGERRGLPHVLLEVRNDQIGDAEGQRRWATLIADSLQLTASAERRKVAH